MRRKDEELISLLAKLRGVECIILIRRSRTVFNQSNHKVFFNFSVSLFISLISALNLPHQYLAGNKLQHSFIILTNFE